MTENHTSGIVRRVVSLLWGLPLEADSDRPSSEIVNNNNDVNVSQELGVRLNLPRGRGQTDASGSEPSESSRPRPRPREGRGRFVHYTSAKPKKGSKGNTPKGAELVPTSEWDQVPCRAVKEQLVKGNFFVDAWTLDKSWSELLNCITYIREALGTG